MGRESHFKNTVEMVGDNIFSWRRLSSFKWLLTQFPYFPKAGPFDFPSGLVGGSRKLVATVLLKCAGIPFIHSGPVLMNRHCIIVWNNSLIDIVCIWCVKLTYSGIYIIYCTLWINSAVDNTMLKLIPSFVPVVIVAYVLICSLFFVTSVYATADSNVLEPSGWISH